VYRDDPTVEVVAFTAAQIPDIAGRRYPASLAGTRYPRGIPIFEEDRLDTLCREQAIEQVIFAYSDIAHARVMHLASRALAAGADFVLLGPQRTMLRSRRSVIAVSAVRTGCGKSQTARWLSALLRSRGLRVAIVRHPMPYGDLERQVCQRFATLKDLEAADCTIEEREEYEPHIALGNVVYAGVDYERVLHAAEADADVIVWDGGNNDFPFFAPDLHIVLVDPLRAGDETTTHPGEAVLRMADVVVISKTDTADAASVETVRESVRRIRPACRHSGRTSPVTLADPAAVRGRRVLVVEDGPTLTHGGMAYGAGYVGATRAGASEIIDPRRFAVGSIADVYRDYPHIGHVLPRRLRRRAAHRARRDHQSLGRRRRRRGDTDRSRSPVVAGQARRARSLRARRSRDAGSRRPRRGVPRAPHARDVIRCASSLLSAAMRSCAGTSRRP
jgi:predicted GTPase